MIEITEVRVSLRNDEKLKAFVSITLNDSFVVRGLKIIHGNTGSVRRDAEPQAARWPAPGSRPSDQRRHPQVPDRDRDGRVRARAGQPGTRSLRDSASARESVY